MGDIICKWRVASVANVIDLVNNMLPQEIIPNQEFRDRMGQGFMKTPYQLACQLGLYYIDANNNYVPRFDHDITAQDAEEYLHRWILRYYAPNPYSPSFRKEFITPIALVPALVEYAELHPNCNYEEACNAIYGETVGNTGAIMGAINSYSKVIEIDRNHIVKLLPNYKEILMADRQNKEEFFKTFSSGIKSTPLTEPLQLIFYGAPGTGKSYKIDNKTNDVNSIRTTFHPDSDYSSFVGAYKPTMADMPINSIYGESVQFATGKNGHPGTEKKIVYKYVPQAFLKAYVDAWKDLVNPHFLIIEEINRGNCAQIFGDLFQLLDRNSQGASSYAINADEDISQFLRDDENGFAKLPEETADAIRSFVLIKDSGKTEAIGDAILSGKKLLLPPNLYIWATMNTSDQSLFPIDSAFKRRWNWEYMPIDYDAMDWQFEAGGKRYLWSDFLKKMNPLIYNLTQSSDKQMGYFFAKADKKTDDTLKENNLISEKIFLNKVLFYLWTDVLKDFEAGDKIFRDEEKGHMYQFSDFFPTTNGKLAEFVGKLELPVIGDSVSDNSSVDDEDDTSGNNTKSSKDQSRYSVNGVGTLKKGPAAVEAMRLYVQNNPDATAADIVSAWKIPRFPLVESEESFASRLAKSNDDRLEKRTELINLANGESIRIFKGFNPQSMQDFINALDKQDWNIIIRKV